MLGCSLTRQWQHDIIHELWIDPVVPYPSIGFTFSSDYSVLHRQISPALMLTSTYFVTMSIRPWAHWRQEDSWRTELVCRHQGRDHCHKLALPSSTYRNRFSAVVHYLDPSATISRAVRITPFQCTFILTLQPNFFAFRLTKDTVAKTTQEDTPNSETVWTTDLLELQYLLMIIVFVQRLGSFDDPECRRWVNDTSEICNLACGGNSQLL